MYPFIAREAFVVTSIVSCLFPCSQLSAEPIQSQQAQKAMSAFLRMHKASPQGAPGTLSIIPGARTADVGRTAAGFREIRSDEGTILAYIAELERAGFVATSANTDITPVIAYSFSCPFPAEADQKNPLYRLLKQDMKLRLKALAEYDQIKVAENNSLWDFYINADTSRSVADPFKQWPPENTTSTGGWLETTWDQDAPYNDLCPLDPVDGYRCYVGCVPTAVAQLANYHRQCGIQLRESDSYTTYSGIDIDGDSDVYEFPSFEELNEYLTALRIKYSRQMELDDTDVAALSFACGIATLTDFTSEGSGASPFDAQSALLEKFGFCSADMTGGLSCEFYRVLQENLINRLPALMGLSPSDGWGGHFLVCDGYNTNGEYHLNFGWGSDHPEQIADVWYHLPTGLPSRYTIIAETILNVRAVPSTVTVDPASLFFYGTPGQESEPQTLFIKNNTMQSLSIGSISSPEGFVVSLSDDAYSDCTDPFQIEHPGQEAAINVKFRPGQAQSYYGTLAIHYTEAGTRHVILKGCAFTGGTEIQAGEVFGTWSQAGSPYFVSGDIELPEDGELVIEPGVKVMFVGPYSMTIGEDGRLAAEGTENYPIEFTALNRDVGWTGLRFVDSSSDDILSHCSITYSKKTAGWMTESDYYDENSDEDSCGGAVYCYYSSPTITNCKITNNIGDKGGAIYCLESYPIISNTVIANNASLGGLPRCGGICSDQWGAPEVKNCTIVNNLPGGIFASSWEDMEVANTILWGNDRYQIETEESTVVASFCDIQGGYRGQGNMGADPCFFAPSSGVGADYDGTSANWTLRSCSPCINAGKDTALPSTDLAGNPRIYSDVADMGAYENQSDLPLITAPASVDADCVHLGTDKTVGFDIANTGKLEFTVESPSISDANGVFSTVTELEGRLLAPGDSVEAEIRFSPLEEGIYTATVHVHSTCSNAPDKAIILRAVGALGTIVAGGPVSGTWTKSESPYTVAGDIRVPKGRALTIEPGVTVKFAGHFSLTVGYRATLDATGTPTNPIVFTPMDTDEGWFGIRFVNSGDDDILKHCTIQYAKKPRSGGGGNLNLTGGAILCCGSWEEEPGFLVPSSPTVDHCIIAQNHAEAGGAIMCWDESKAVITNNTIVDNSADINPGGILIADASPTIANNVIAHNSGLEAGGIMTWNGSPSIINNTIVHNRPSGLYLGPTVGSLWGPEASPPVLNNIVWHNEICILEYVLPEEYDIRFNNMQGGWEGQDNIDVDPLFADPDNRDYHLKSQAGRWDATAGTWVRDNVTSPCIDAGNPDADSAAELPPNGECINMGAFGGTIEASLSDSPADHITDLNNDDATDARDLLILADTWLTQGVPVAEDINRDGSVSLPDLAILAQRWRWEQ